MALMSKEEKDALADYYRGKDLYDPSKESGQAPPSFAQALDSPAQGYADGGDVQDIDLSTEPVPEAGFDGPQVSTVDNRPVPAPFNRNAAPESTPVPRPASPRPQGAAIQPPPASLPPQNALAAPGAVPGRLQPYEFDQLVKYLQPGTGQRVGQASMSALAGLADAINTGVARTNGSSFQKNIEESRQHQKENLLNALKGKQELKLGQERLHEEQRQHDLEAGARSGTLAYEQAKESRENKMEKQKLEADENKNAMDQSEKTGSLWNMAKNKLGIGVPGPDPAILARAQGKAAPVAASGPYGPSVVKDGKTYIWSPVSHQYHPE